MTIKIFENGYVTDEVSTVKPYEANTSEENRIKFVTDCAAISRGKSESNNPKKRYEHLLKEAAPNECGTTCNGVAGRPLEFLPIVLDMRKEKHMFLYELAEIEDISRFTYWPDHCIYTNARALLNAGIPYEDLPFNTEEELKDFKVVKVKAPYFVFAQIRTHCMISQIAASARVIEENEIWLPDDFEERVDNEFYPNGKLYSDYDYFVKTHKINRGKIFLDMIKSKWKYYTIHDLQNLFKKLGYKKEIWQRYPQHALYKTWIMAGWFNDPKVWNHFFLERGVFEDKYKNWVQPETKQVAKAIYEVIVKG